MHQTWQLPTSTAFVTDKITIFFFIKTKNRPFFAARPQKNWHRLFVSISPKKARCATLHPTYTLLYISTDTTNCKKNDKNSPNSSAKTHENAQNEA